MQLKQALNVLEQLLDPDIQIHVKRVRYVILRIHFARSFQELHSRFRRCIANERQTLLRMNIKYYSYLGKNCLSLNEFTELYCHTLY